MRRSIMEPGYVGQRGRAVGKLTDAQIAERMTWAQVPDSQVALAAMHVTHVRPVNGSTVVHVNPTDPATEGDVSNGYLVRPSSYAPVVKAGRTW